VLDALHFGGEISFARFLDEGLTFQNEHVISRPIDFFPFGCHIDVGPNSEVCVAYSGRGAGFPIISRRSLDGGLTWLAPIQVNSLPIRQRGTDRVVLCEARRTTLAVVDARTAAAREGWHANESSDCPVLHASHHNLPSGAIPIPREAPTPDPRLTPPQRGGTSPGSSLCYSEDNYSGAH
jgi:hypothetical protein